MASNDRCVVARFRFMKSKCLQIFAGDPPIIARAAWIIACDRFKNVLLLRFIRHDAINDAKEADIVVRGPSRSIRRALVALHVPGKIADLIVYANDIAQKMTGLARIRLRRYFAVSLRSFSSASGWSFTA